MFVLEGMLGICCFLVWIFVAFDDPASHPRISRAEKEYIESTITSTAKKQVSVSRYFVQVNGPHHSSSNSGLSLKIVKYGHMMENKSELFQYDCI